jgi:transcriptional regulator with XRE-family HTH domain
MVEQDICIVFAANVRRIRRAQEMSQEELAHRAGLHRTYVSGLERGGSRNPTIRVAHCIAKALNVPLMDLFDERELRVKK